MAFYKHHLFAKPGHEETKVRSDRTFLSFHFWFGGHNWLCSGIIFRSAGGFTWGAGYCWVLNQAGMHANKCLPLMRSLLPSPIILQKQDKYKIKKNLPISIKSFASISHNPNSHCPKIFHMRYRFSNTRHKKIKLKYVLKK